MHENARYFAVCALICLFNIIALSPIGRIQIRLIWGILGASIFDCVIRPCGLFDWLIRTCFGPTVIPAVITSLELFCVLTMCYFSDNVLSKEKIKYYG